MTTRSYIAQLVAAALMAGLSMFTFGLNFAYAVSEYTTITNPRIYEERAIFEEDVTFNDPVGYEYGTSTAFLDTTLNAASTTPFQIRPSTTGTTTIDRFTLTMTVSSSTASIVSIAKAAGPTATTTVLQSFAVAADAKVTFAMASSTVLGPNEYLVVAMQGGTGTFSPTGIAAGRYTSVPF